MGRHNSRRYVRLSLGRVDARRALVLVPEHPLYVVRAATRLGKSWQE